MTMNTPFPGRAMIIGSFFVAGALALPGDRPARAEPSPPRLAAAPAPANPVPAIPGRYQLVKTENGTAWRLDTVTGEITVCRMESDRMICAKSTEATELPKATPEQLEKQRLDERRERRAEKTEMFDKFFAFFERILRFADKHADKMEPPAKKDEYARPL